MTVRTLLFTTAAILTFSVFASADGVKAFRLASEPLIRIGLSTNSGSVTITTADSSLIAVSADEPSKTLAATRVVVSARAYKPPEIEQYRIEFQNLPAQTDANELAKDIHESTGETAIPSLDPQSNTWRVWVGSVKPTEDDA